jgi:hypothetical protein
VLDGILLRSLKTYGLLNDRDFNQSRLQIGVGFRIVVKNVGSLVEKPLSRNVELFE